ncbi:MAG: endonuclease/exonuclease/phosphatase family protein [Planctomycetales bacterium]|nr:endonuclease/exonuclease/phosphatase family protein [Planctomycetales bacterium]
MCPGTPCRPWSERGPEAVRLLQERRPNVIGLQEASYRQATDLASGLGGLEIHREGDPRGEFVPILFDKERFSRVAGGAFWFAEDSGWVGTRRCNWVRLEDRQSRGRFEFYNCHWDNESVPGRERAARTLLRHLLERPDPLPAIVAGDLNGPWSDGPIRILESDPTLALQDALPRTADDARWLQAEQRWQRVDYILATRHWRVLGSSVLQAHGGAVPPSDHRPVLATLELRSG